MGISPRQARFLRRWSRVILGLIGSLLLLLVLILVAIRTSYVQNLVRGRIESYLTQKLHTQVRIGNLYVGFPRTVQIRNLYVEDLQKDSLVYAEKLGVDIDLFQLLHHSVRVSRVELEGLRAKGYRDLPDTLFNFQFIIDAFASGNPQTEKTKPGKPWQFRIDQIVLAGIHVSFRDRVSGKALDLRLDRLETSVRRIGPGFTAISLNDLAIGGLRGYYNALPGLRNSVPEGTRRSARSPWVMDAKKVSLRSIQLVYRQSEDSLFSRLDLGALEIQGSRLDLGSRRLDLLRVHLAQTMAALRLGPKSEGWKNEEGKMQGEMPDSAAGWQIRIGSLLADQDHLLFDNDRKAPRGSGMDYAHLDVRDLFVDLRDFRLGGDSVAGFLAGARLREKSGFVLNKLETHFYYGSQQAFLRDLDLITPASRIRRNLAIRYDSIGSLKNEPGSLGVDVDLAGSRIQVGDLLIFAPSLRKFPFFSRPEEVWALEAAVKGRVSRLGIRRLRMEGPGGSLVDLDGRLDGLPQFRQTAFQVQIHLLKSCRGELTRLLPPGILPATLHLPETFSLEGRVSWQKKEALANLSLGSSFGAARIEARARDPQEASRASYRARLESLDFRVDSLLGDPALPGAVSATLDLEGKGFAIRSAEARINAQIHSAEYKKYVYRDLHLDGDIRARRISLRADLKDPNLYFSLQARADMSRKYPSIQMDLKVDSLKTSPLHLTEEALAWRGEFHADIPVSNPDSLEGTMVIRHSLLVRNGQRYPLDSLVISAGPSDSGQWVAVHGDALDLRLTGKYRLNEIPEALQQSLDPYISLGSSAKKQKISPCHFLLRGEMRDAPLLHALMPGLVHLEPIKLETVFDADTGFYALLTLPELVYDGGNARVEGLSLVAGTRTRGLVLNARLGLLRSGTNIQLFQTGLDATLAHNRMDFDLLIKDRGSKDKYHLLGSLDHSPDSGYTFALSPEKLLLNYEAWMVNPGNRVQFGRSGLRVGDFELSRQGQRFNLRSQGLEPEAPLQISFREFRIATLTGFMQSDSLLGDGILQSDLLFSHPGGAASLSGTLSIRNLSFRRDTIGNLEVRLNKASAGQIAAEVGLSGEGNQLRVQGIYFLKPADGNQWDLALDIDALQLHSLQGAARSLLNSAAGSLSGKLRLRGNLQSPQLSGQIHFDRVLVNPVALNAEFGIDGQDLLIDPQGIRFRSFSIDDSAKNKLVVDGQLLTADFRRYIFDLTVRARNFQALNSRKKHNALYYGKLVFNSNLTLKGTEKAPEVSGNLTVGDKTNLTLVLPQAEPGLQERDGIVRFVNRSVPADDSLAFRSADSLNSSSLRGVNVSVNLSINKAAEMNLVIDQDNGDVLNLKGGASLNAGIDPSGKVTITGAYQLEDGSYDLSFSLLHRKFAIQKGSTITWAGEATKATLDISAVYTANAPPIDLVQAQLDPGTASTTINMYRQKLPFQIYLKMTGELMKPQVSFDIDLPQDQNFTISSDMVGNVRAKLALLRNDKSELDKQVFALLLLNHFVGDNPFETAGGGTDAETLAKQSVSKILADQLNRLAGSLVKGVDIDLDFNSTQDYSSGTLQDRTDLNLAVSKRLLNDRLTVTVGSDFQLEGQNANQNATNLAGNLAVNYALSKDGRYALRAYRKNDYEGIVEGYLIESGVGFVITLDYEHFYEIFRKKKKQPAPVPAVALPETNHPEKAAATGQNGNHGQ